MSGTSSQVIAVQITVEEHALILAALKLQADTFLNGVDVIKDDRLRERIQLRVQQGASLITKLEVAI